jgi:MFS family permease
MGVLLYALSTSIFGLISLIDHDSHFFYAAIGARFMQGIADALISCPVISLVTVVFENHKDSCMGIMQSSNAAGVMIGPIMGSFVYSLFGYLYTFVFFTIFISVVGLMSGCSLP